MTRNDLPTPVLRLLLAAEKADFEVLWENVQNKSMRYGDRISRYGWNTGRNGDPVHWYIRRSAIDERHIPLLRDREFVDARHGEVWKRPGGDDIGAATEDFRVVLEALTGAQLERSGT